MPVECKCRQCNRVFLRSPSLPKVYCSVACRAQGQVKPLLWKQVKTVWRHMLDRCYLKTSSSYSRYGAKGISVCSEWREDFTVFYEWAVASGYAPELELDRRETLGNYEPGNCRWTTHSLNMANARKRDKKTTSVFKGVSFCKRLKRWVAECTLNKKSYYLGSHATEREAAEAYDDKMFALAGEHARLNFPERKAVA